MKYLFLVSVILFCIGGMFSAQRQLQMLQQNSYYLSRYLGWVRSTKFGTLKYSLIFMLLPLIISVDFLPFFLPVYSAIELIYRIQKQQKNHKTSIKKLVYTGRVKRLISAMCLLYALIIVAFISFPSATLYILALSAALGHFPQIIMFIAFYINKPIESGIAKWYVKDAKKILASNKNLICIGVTGSYGKTSVKFMLNRILSEKFNTLATPESFNTPMGIVRTVRSSLTPATEIFIAEMGAKNIGDIKELCDICNPDIGIITAVGPQHLETFKTVENVANTKFELADCCLKKEDGKIYVNFDSEVAKTKALTLEKQDKVISFGENNASATATNIVLTENGTEFTLNYKSYSFPLSCKLLGKHSITNLLGAVAIALDLGVSEKQIRFAASSLKAPPHRLELKPFINGSLLIDDAYNSNPVGCLEAVNVLSAFNGKKRIIVTPGLVELGDKEYEFNYNLGEAAAKGCDIIILVGQNRAKPMADAINKSDFNKENLHIADSFANAMNILRTITDENTVVLFENDLPDNYAG